MANRIIYIKVFHKQAVLLLQGYPATGVSKVTFLFMYFATIGTSYPLIMLQWLHKAGKSGFAKPIKADNFTASYFITG